MRYFKEIRKILNTADKYYIDEESKIIIFSDIHRGDGGWSDNFSANQNIYFAALDYYYKNNYNYIENGDADELWENKDMLVIKEMHSDVFWLMSKFYDENRLYLIYGNHDMDKKNKKYANKYFSELKDKSRGITYSLFPRIKMNEGLVLQYKNKGEMLIIHGHQVDFINNELWKLSKFLVRYLWRPLEVIGVNNPTRAAKNNDKKEKIDNILSNCCIKEKCIIISGHTHRPMFPTVKNIPYFNGGSCVHPRCITGIEIVGGSISLIKWSVKTKGNNTLVVTRDVLGGPNKLDDYFKVLKQY